MFYLLLLLALDLGWVPPEAVVEARIREQMVYLENDPRKHWLRERKLRNGRKEANTWCVIQQVTTVGNWTLIPRGRSGIQGRTHDYEFSCLRVILQLLWVPGRWRRATCGGGGMNIRL